MTASYKDWSVGYRSKNEQKTCAISFPPNIQHYMGSPSQVSVEVCPPEPGSKYLLKVQAHPDGFKFDFKRGNGQAEINVAWAALERRPPTLSGKGRLPCWTDRFLPGVIVVDITSWLRDSGDQPALFTQMGKILLPNDSTGTGAFRYATAIEDDE